MKALKSVVSNVGRFDGKNISKFLRVYLCFLRLSELLLTICQKLQLDSQAYNYSYKQISTLDFKL